MPESPPVFRVSSMSHQPWLAATSKHHHHSLESQTQVTSKDSDSFVSNSTRHSHCLSWRQSTGLVPHMAISSHWPRVTVIHNLEPFLMPHFLLLLVWQFHRYKSLKVIYLSQSTSFAVLLATNIQYLTTVWQQACWSSTRSLMCLTQRPCTLADQHPGSLKVCRCPSHVRTHTGQHLHWPESPAVHNVTAHTPRWCVHMAAAHSSGLWHTHCQRLYTPGWQPSTSSNQNWSVNSGNTLMVKLMEKW